MKKMTNLVLTSLFLFLGLVNVVRAQEESSADKFLGSPLLILTIVIIIDLIAMVFHKIKK